MLNSVSLMTKETRESGQGNDIVVEGNGSEVLSLSGVLTFATNNRDVLALTWADEEHEVQATKPFVCKAIRLCVESIILVFVPTIWALVVLASHCLHACNHMRRDRRSAHLQQDKSAISLPKRKHSKDGQVRKSATSNVRRRGAREQGSTINEDGAKTFRKFSSVELKEDEPTAEYAQIKSSSKMRRVSTHNLKSLLQKEASDNQKEKIVHHLDALFYLHASPEYLEKHILESHSHIKDSFEEATKDMVEQRRKFKQGFEQHHHHEDFRDEETDWETESDRD